MKYHVWIISDTVCPWCYVGYRNLQAAISEYLSAYPTDTFSISWHPFQLNPDAPKGQSVDKRASYNKNLGSMQAQVVFKRLESAGKRAGINFSFGGRTGNTLDSHRLIELAAQKDNTNEASQTITDTTPSKSLQTRLVEELFADYFESEQDITSHDVLSKAAARAGLNKREIDAFLASDKLAVEVERQAQVNRSESVTGVPHFTINDEFTVEGAQEPAAFLMLFKRLKTLANRQSGANL